MSYNGHFAATSIIMQWDHRLVHLTYLLVSNRRGFSGLTVLKKYWKVLNMFLCLPKYNYSYTINIQAWFSFRMPWAERWCFSIWLNLNWSGYWNLFLIMITQWMSWKQYSCKQILTNMVYGMAANACTLHTACIKYSLL